MTYTDHEYRTGIKAYANSDLGELARNGRPFNVKPETLQFGTVFHTWILEPNKDADDSLITLEQRNHLAWMLARMASDEQDEVMNLIHNGQRETVRLWTDPATGLPCKAKLDCVVMPKAQHLIDLKTTSSTSEASFIDSLTRYDYDRQAAFYLSSDPNAKYFELVAVQKQPPYAVFRCPFHRDSDFIQGGMKKMRYLLAMAKAEADNPNGWRPSSWSRIDQQA